MDMEMENEFNALEAKIAQLVGLCQNLYQENAVLKQQLTAVLQEKQQYSERIEQAKLRIEALLQTLPEVNAALPFENTN